MSYIDSINDEQVTYVTTATLHALGSIPPYLTFTLPYELADYSAPKDFSITVPDTIKWPHYSCGVFDVDLILTLSTSTMEVLEIVDVRPNPSLENGF